MRFQSSFILTIVQLSALYDGVALLSRARAQDP